MVCSCLYLVSYARFDIERTIMRFCLQNQMLSMEVFAHHDDMHMVSVKVFAHLMFITFYNVTM